MIATKLPIARNSSLHSILPPSSLATWVFNLYQKEEGFSYLGEKEEAIKAKMLAINNVLIVLAVAENSKLKTKIRLTQINRVSSQNARFDR
ncbi:hypothetical protein [Microcoleus sp. B3-D2]|uniref:hypothetical protein n=1 Tax=Microcoleus sp. B3-D2 TaxID=2818655 RepID=UPI002FD03E3A